MKQPYFKEKRLISLFHDLLAFEVNADKAFPAAVAKGDIVYFIAFAANLSRMVDSVMVTVHPHLIKVIDGKKFLRADQVVGVPAVIDPVLLNKVNF